MVVGEFGGIKMTLETLAKDIAASAEADVKALLKRLDDNGFCRHINSGTHGDAVGKDAATSASCVSGFAHDQAVTF